MFTVEVDPPEIAGRMQQDCQSKIARAFQTFVERFHDLAAEGAQCASAKKTNENLDPRGNTEIGGTPKANAYDRCGLR